MKTALRDDPAARTDLHSRNRLEIPRRSMYRTPPISQGKPTCGCGDTPAYARSASPCGSASSAVHGVEVEHVQQGYDQPCIVRRALRRSLESPSSSLLLAFFPREASLGSSRKSRTLSNSVSRVVALVSLPVFICGVLILTTPLSTIIPWSCRIPLSPSMVASNTLCPVILLAC